MLIISGISKGIGAFLGEKFHSSGEVVYGLYNNTEPDNKNFEIFKADITNNAQIDSFYDHIKDKSDGKLVLINCAGINYNATLHNSDIDAWKKVIDVNVFGTFLITRKMISLMREDGYGRIINFSSVVPKIGIPGTSAYSTSKAALWGFTKAVATENAKKGITINTINLGYFNVGMIKEVPENILEGMIDKIPNRRLGDPEEIFNTIKYIISTPYINASEVNVNGGLY